LRCPRCNSVQRTRGAVILRIAPQVRQRYSRCSAASTKQIAALLAAVASDAVAVLLNPQDFAPLRLFPRSCGSFRPSACFDTLNNCQHPAHTSPARTTSAERPRQFGSGMNVPPCAYGLHDIWHRRSYCSELAVQAGGTRATVALCTVG
jgi:hypothetical protein